MTLLSPAVRLVWLIKINTAPLERVSSYDFSLSLRARRLEESETVLPDSSALVVLKRRCHAA